MDAETQDSVPRGIIEVNRCLSIKGAEDVINKPHAFEISTTEDSMFFIADSDKVSDSLLSGWAILSFGLLPVMELSGYRVLLRGSTSVAL